MSRKSRYALFRVVGSSRVASHRNLTLRSSSDVKRDRGIVCLTRETNLMHSPPVASLIFAFPLFPIPVTGSSHWVFGVFLYPRTSQGLFLQLFTGLRKTLPNDIGPFMYSILITSHTSDAIGPLAPGRELLTWPWTVVQYSERSTGPLICVFADFMPSRKMPQQVSLMNAA